MVSVNITVPASSPLLSPVRLRRSNNSGKLPTDPFCRGLVDRATHPKTVTHNMRLGAHTVNAACVSIFFSHDALLPRLHSADKVFSFALNYPKYFPKAPGTASKSFYRQETEAQRAEGEKKKGWGGWGGNVKDKGQGDVCSRG